MSYGFFVAVSFLAAGFLVLAGFAVLAAFVVSLAVDAALCALERFFFGLVVSAGVCAAGLAAAGVPAGFTDAVEVVFAFLVVSCLVAWACSCVPATKRAATAASA